MSNMSCGFTNSKEITNVPTARIAFLLQTACVWNWVHVRNLVRIGFAPAAEVGVTCDCFVDLGYTIYSVDVLAVPILDGFGVTLTLEVVDDVRVIRLWSEKKKKKKRRQFRQNKDKTMFMGFTRKVFSPYSIVLVLSIFEEADDVQV